MSRIIYFLFTTNDLDTGGRATQEQLPRREGHEVYVFSSCSSCLRGEKIMRNSGMFFSWKRPNPRLGKAGVSCVQLFRLSLSGKTMHPYQRVGFPAHSGMHFQDNIPVHIETGVAFRFGIGIGHVA